MENIKISNKDQIIMSLVHYFVTKEAYTPIIVKGAKDEIWLENLESEIKIIRINSNYIHNDEQHNLDLLKFNHVLKQIKKKTFSFNVSALNICLDLADRVDVKSLNKIETLSIKNMKEIKKSEYLNKIFPGINTDLISKTGDLEMLKNVTDDINESTNKRNEIYEKVFKSKKIIVTYILIGLCTFFYLLTTITNNELIYFGANIGYAVIQNKEYYRLLSSIFLHVNIIHLFVNMYSLNVLGTQLETFIGKAKFLIIFLLSGITGSLFSILFNGDLTVSVGASGAIFGLASALVYFGYHYRVYLNNALTNQLVPIIALNLLLGFTISGIDNSAHIGGLIGGYLVASIVGVKERNNISEQKNSFIAYLILIIFIVYMINVR